MAYNLISSSNKAIWARRTKCHSPPYPYYYENKKLLFNYVMHMWAVSRNSSPMYGDLENVKLLFMNTFPHYCINTCSKLLPNKYMELNETKAIAGVLRNGPNSLYKYFINGHPLKTI